MSTIDSRAIIDAIIAGDGYYQGDPRVALIVEYENASGRTTWGVTWSSEPASRQQRYLEETEFVRAPRVLWRPSRVS